MNGLVLFPPVSLVQNTGFDGSGTHGRGMLRKFTKIGESLFPTSIDLPNAAELDAKHYVCVKKALWRQNGGLIGMAVDKLRWWKTFYSNEQ
jgi:hypothetical protein